jgi:hypothetical protein
MVLNALVILMIFCQSNYCLLFQLTFVSDEVLPPELSRNFTFGGTTYTLYSNSFLNFGQNAAQESFHEILRSKGIFLLILSM